jgi:histone H3/H4
MADIIRKKQAKEMAKKAGLRFPDSAIEALDKWVMDSINKAAKRATANGRKTIQEHDF